ncbi:MAG: GNAT family N-acetyltransferase [Defluviitaleaceae bacterium]|nr:GNAT family N-acetyltransferase [Defluviitaleaceae bacterium]
MLKIIPYDSKYKADIILCFLLAKNALLPLAPESHSRLTIREDILDIETHYTAKNYPFLLAVNENDRVIGMLGCNILPATVSQEELILKRFFIHPEMKNRGIGSMLLSEIESFAESRGISIIHTRFAYWYKEANIFYTAKGFRKSGEISGAINEKDYLIRMHKKI